jgi:hypothetical protein
VKESYAGSLSYGDSPLYSLKIVSLPNLPQAGQDFLQEQKDDQFILEFEGAANPDLKHRKLTDEAVKVSTMVLGADAEKYSAV